MKIKPVSTCVLCCAALWSTAGQAEFSANLALTSDYIWRGISQTLGDPAVQGSVDYAHDSGFYLGAWASNVDFFSSSAPDSAPEDDDEADVELDLYVGFSGETEAGIGWDLGVIQYRFPGARRSLLDDNEEFYVGASYDIFSAMVYRDFENETTYVEAGLDLELPHELNLALHVGYFDFDGTDDYIDYRVAVSRAFAGFEFSLDFTDTDLSSSECAEGYWFRDLCDGTLSFSVSREFTF